VSIGAPFADIVERAELVRDRIEAAGGHGVTLVAVTKAFSIEAVEAALAAGLVEVGENYAQELVDKAEQLVTQPRWHFIGGLQTNKIRALAPHVTLWQSVDRERLVGEIAKRAPGAAILVQVNLAGADERVGCTWEAVPALVDRALESGLDVRGLMGVAPLGTEADVRASFRRLVALAERLGLPERSIGMSADLEIAVQEGSTMVRIGRDLFGERPARTA
jgi:hypothetical protein